MSQLKQATQKSTAGLALSSGLRAGHHYHPYGPYSPYGTSRRVARRTARRTSRRHSYYW